MQVQGRAINAEKKVMRRRFDARGRSMAVLGPAIASWWSGWLMQAKQFFFFPVQGSRLFGVTKNDVDGKREPGGIGWEG